MFSRQAGKNNGFTIIEAIIAVVILSIVGIGIARFFLNATQSATQIRRMTKASSLFDMVFEQYAAKAGVNFHTLPNFTGSVQEFFGTADNMSMDGMTIVTSAQYAGDRSNCNVNVTIKWKEGSQEKELTRSKLFLPQNTRPTGSNVTVTATYNGVAIPNLTATAPSVYGGMVTAVTDSSGTAVLASVLPGTDIPIKITSVLADYDAPPTASHVLGYYALVGGNYVTSLTIPWQVEVAHTEPVPVTDFIPTGQITGSVINDDDPTITGNQKVTLGTTTVTLVHKGGLFLRCGTDIASCFVKTDSTAPSTGRYTFYNVIPTAGKLYADGSTGSSSKIQPGEPGFFYGTCNPTPYPFALTDWDAALHRTLRADVHVRRTGWITIAPTFNGSPAPAGTTVQIRQPATRHYLAGNVTLQVIDPKTTVSFYNLIDDNALTFTVTGDKAPPPDSGYFASRSWSCPSYTDCLGRNNDIALPMDVGYRFEGQLRDVAGNPPENVDGIVVSMPSLTAPTTTNATGNFNFPRFSPLMAGSPYSGDPAVPSPAYVFLKDWSLLLPITVNGRTVDRETNQVAPHVSLLQNGMRVIRSDVNGVFQATNFPYSYPSMLIKIFCVAAESTCYPTTSQTSPSPAPIPIDTSATKAVLQDADNADPDCWWLNYTQYSATLRSGQTASTELKVSLVGYYVQGVVTNGLTGLPVAGIKIRDVKTGDTEATTNAEGVYSGIFSVSGRTISNPGKVILDVTSQTINGVKYPAIPPAALPVPSGSPDPTIPLTNNFTYQYVGTDI